MYTMMYEYFDERPSNDEPTEQSGGVAVLEASDDAVHLASAMVETVASKKDEEALEEAHREDARVKEAARFASWVLFGEQEGGRSPYIKARTLEAAVLALDGLRGATLTDDAKDRLEILEKRVVKRQKPRPKKSTAELGAPESQKGRGGGRHKEVGVIDPNRDISWQKHAACKGVEVALLYPSDEKKANQAIKECCDRCSVRQECLEQGILEHDVGAVRGGVYLTATYLKMVRSKK